MIISVFFDELDLSKNIFTIREKKTDTEEVYSEEEIPIIKEYLLKKDSLRYLGILLVFVTGLRVGELAALKPEDIRLKENSGTIHVCRTEVHYNEEKEPGKRKTLCGFKSSQNLKQEIERLLLTALRYRFYGVFKN